MIENMFGIFSSTLNFIYIFIGLFRVPAPLHTTDILSHELNSDFPANHPFASHISENAVFPTATADLHDRPSTCTDPYIVTHKIRGK